MPPGFPARPPGMPPGEPRGAERGLVLKVLTPPKWRANHPFWRGHLGSSYTWLYGCVWKCCVPHCTQWFCWSLSRFEMAISLGIYTLFSDKPICMNEYQNRNSWSLLKFPAWASIRSGDSNLHSRRVPFFMHFFGKVGFRGGVLAADPDPNFFVDLKKSESDA